MSETTDDTIAVEHNGETVDVPRTFERNDCAAWFGPVPDEWTIDAVFTLDGALRVGAFVDDERWVEAVRHTDDWHETFNAHNDRGWVADVVENIDPDGGIPGEILWESDD